MSVDVTDATLVVDSLHGEKTLGTRGFALADRQLVFRADDAYVELRLPPSRAVPGGSAWLYGQHVGRGEGAAGPVRVRVLPPHGTGFAVEAGPTGDFAVPYREDVRGTLVLEVLSCSGAALVVRFEP